MVIVLLGTGIGANSTMYSIWGKPRSYPQHLICFVIAAARREIGGDTPGASRVGVVGPFGSRFSLLLLNRKQGRRPVGVLLSSLA